MRNVRFVACLAKHVANRLLFKASLNRLLASDSVSHLNTRSSKPFGNTHMFFFDCIETSH